MGGGFADSDCKITRCRCVTCTLCDIHGVRHGADQHTGKLGCLWLVRCLACKVFDDRVALDFHSDAVGIVQPCVYCIGKDQTVGARARNIGGIFGGAADV